MTLKPQSHGARVDKIPQGATVTIHPSTKLQATSPLDQFQSSFVLVRGAHHGRLAEPHELTDRIGISRWRVIVVVADKSEKRL